MKYLTAILLFLTNIAFAANLPQANAYTVAKLPSCSTSNAGQQVFVTDAQNATALATPVGGGNNIVQAVCDSKWIQAGFFFPTGGGSTQTGRTLFTPLHTYYIAASGCNDANAGTSAGSPWCTPNHSVVCGDVIIAASGTYSAMAAWGTVSTCPSTTGGIDGHGGVYFATLLCGGPDLNSCLGSGGMRIAASNWAVEGWANTNSTGFCFLADARATGITIYHHIAFINDVAYNCDDGYTTGDGGLNHNVPGNGVDQFAVIGSIAQNSNQDPICVAALDDPGPANFDASAGTHVLWEGNYLINNNYGCNPSDGEAMMFDTWDAHGYTGAGVMENNIAYLSARYGIQAFSQGFNASTATITIRNNTLFANNATTFALTDNGGCGDINLQASGATTWNYSASIYNNIVLTNYAHRGGISTNCNVYALLIGGSYSVTVGGSGIQNYFLGSATTCAPGSGHCDSGSSPFSAASYGSGALLGTNTYATPSFANTADLLANHTGVPTLTGFTNTAAAMGWNYSTQTANSLSVIGDLVAAAGAAGKGYQPPGLCATNALYPSYLKGVVYLQVVGSSIYEYQGLVNQPCNT